MARALPYRARAPPAVQALIEEAPYSRLFVLADPGPTSFVLRGETPRRFKVSIGETHSCSCHAGNELCQHVLFVLTRVFRMPAANPLIWQLSLTEREIAELMRGRVNIHTRPPPRAAPAAGEEGADGESSDVERKELGEDPCPICYDDMAEGQEITFCKKACGNNVHTKCMRMWADNRIASGDEVTCPMCRTGWGVPDWLGSNSVRTRRERFDGLAVHHGIQCRGCSTINFAGTRYKCMICNNYDLCSECFTGGSAHRQHPFVSREGIDSDWVAAERDGEAAPDAPSGEMSGTGTVSVDLLTKLPTKSVTEDECGGGSGSDARCGVCGDAFRPGQVARTLPCACRYHQRCIDRRLMEQMDVCPNGVAGRGVEACAVPITAETVQVQLEMARAQHIAVSRRRDGGRNRRRPAATDGGVRANATGALDFSLGGLSISGGSAANVAAQQQPSPSVGPAAARENEQSLLGLEPGSAVAAELQRKRAALAALERQRDALLADHASAQAEESQVRGELGDLLSAEGLGVIGSGSSAIIGSSSPVEAALTAEAERRNANAEADRRNREATRARRAGGAGHPARLALDRSRARPSTVGEEGSELAVGSGAAGGAGGGSVVAADGSGSARSRTAPLSVGGDEPGMDRSASDRRGRRTGGGRRQSNRPARQPMDPRSQRAAPRGRSEQEEPTVGWEGMFVGTTSGTGVAGGESETSVQRGGGQSPRGSGRGRGSGSLAAAAAVQRAQRPLAAEEGSDLSVGLPASGGGRPSPGSRRRSGGRLLPRGSLRATAGGAGPAAEEALSPRSAAAQAVTNAGAAATAAALAESQAAAREGEAAVLADAERQRVAAAAEARTARLAREERRRAAAVKAAEDRESQAQREEGRAEAKRQAQERKAARGAAHREEQLQAEAARRSAREEASEARNVVATW